MQQYKSQVAEAWDQDPSSDTSLARDANLMQASQRHRLRGFFVFVGCLWWKTMVSCDSFFARPVAQSSMASWNTFKTCWSPTRVSVVLYVVWCGDSAPHSVTDVGGVFVFW